MPRPRTRPAVLWQAEHPHPNVCTVRIQASYGSTHRFLLATDRHWDNPDSDHAMQRKHLDEAVACGAGVIDAGDLFCAMQGKFDKRSNKSKVRPEHQTGDYLDSLVRTAADFFEPYSHNLLVVGRGNHETAIQNRHETDLTERLVASLNDRTGSKIQAGGYTGWVRFMLNRGETRMSVLMWYCHGWGGGGPVTIGTIQAANRMPMMVDGADIIFTGHIHEAWAAEKVRTSLTSNGRPVQRTLHICQGATYKDEDRDGYGGWHVETGKPPKPVGAWWLDLTWTKRNREEYIGISLQRAT